MGFSIKKVFKKVKEAVSNIPTKQGLKTFLVTGGMLPGIQEYMLTDSGMDTYDAVHKGIVDGVTGGAVFSGPEAEREAKAYQKEQQDAAAAKEADRLADILPDDIAEYGVQRSTDQWNQTAEERMAIAKGHYGDLDVKYWDEADQNLSKALTARDAGNAGDQDKFFKLWRREFAKTEATGLKAEAAAATQKKADDKVKTALQDDFMSGRGRESSVRNPSGKSFGMSGGAAMTSILGINSASDGGSRSVLGI